MQRRKVAVHCIKGVFDTNVNTLFGEQRKMTICAACRAISGML